MEYYTERESVSTNTSTKIFPATRELLFIHVIFTSDATAGNRQLEMELLDPSGNVIMDMHAGVTQAASLTRHYEFIPGIFRETAFIDGTINVPLPTGMAVPGGYSVRVKDNANVSVSDTMVIGWQYKNLAA